MLPTIKSDSIYPLPNDVAIFNINIVDIIFLIGIICLIIKRKSIFNANNDVLDKYNSNKIKGLLALLIIIHHLSIYIKETILLKVFTIVGVIAVSAFFFYSGYGLMTSYLKKENYLITDNQAEKITLEVLKQAIAKNILGKVLQNLRYI